MEDGGKALNYRGWEQSMKLVFEEMCMTRRCGKCDLTGIYGGRRDINQDDFRSSSLASRGSFLNSTTDVVLERHTFFWTGKFQKGLKCHSLILDYVMESSRVQDNFFVNMI